MPRLATTSVAALTLATVLALSTASFLREWSVSIFVPVNIADTSVANAANRRANSAIDRARSRAANQKGAAATDGTAASTGAADPEANASDEEDEACFPGVATVELQDGSLVRMEDVSIGDIVKVGVNEYSRVFMFTHKMADTFNKFVSLRMASAKLDLSAGHYLYVNGALAAAETVVIGDIITIASGGEVAVEAVGSVNRAGLYNPQTMSGTIAVNGMLASTYTTAVDPSFAHAVLLPFRMLSNIGMSFSGFDCGGGALGQAAPKGASVL